MSRQIALILLIVAGTTLAAALVGLRTRIDDNSAIDRGYVFFDGTPEPMDRGPTKTLTPREQEIDDLVARSKDATFRVTYQRRGSSSIYSMETVYQLGSSYRRTDTTSRSGDLNQSFVLPEAAYGCGWFDEPTCLTLEDLRQVLSESISDSFIPAPSPGDLLGRGDRIETVLAAPSETPMATIEPTTTHFDREFAGQPAICFVENDGDSLSERCYTKDGVELFTHYKFGSIEITSEAISFSREVNEADFKLPYPVVESTFAPTTPISPPSAASPAP